ncbi:MAG: DUF6414 family protein, partial [Finegoldia magna]|nr:DUF6414 family protein [Finegoldia magna]
MSDKSSTTQLCKIIYFDDESITDYLQLMSGGKLEKTTELLENASKDEKAGADAATKIGFGGLIKALLGWNAEVGVTASAGLSFNSEKMVKNIIKNTIL